MQHVVNVVASSRGHDFQPLRAIRQRAARLRKEGPADYHPTCFDSKVEHVPFPTQPYGTCQLGGGDLGGTMFVMEPSVGSSTNSLEEKQNKHHLPNPCLVQPAARLALEPLPPASQTVKDNLVKTTGPPTCS